MLRAGDLPGDGKGGGAGVGADDGVDADDVQEFADFFDGHVGVAGCVYGEAFNGLSEDAAGVVQLFDGEVEGLLASVGGFGGVGEVQHQADFQVVVG